MPEPRRTFQLTLAFGVLVVYAALAAAIGRSHYALVSDYIAMANIHGGWWPAAILRRLVDPFEAGAWLYRPFADAMSWLLALLLERHVGAWHVVLIVIRLVSSALAYLVAREVTESEVAACAGAAYFAFFPAIPEIDLIRVETWLMLSLAVAFYGYCRLSVVGGRLSVAPLRRDPRAAQQPTTDNRQPATIIITAIAFVAATMSKEVVAPLLLAFLCFLVPPLWRRGVGGRVAVAIMALAMANQAVRFALLAAEPYASQRAGGFVSALLHQGYWTVKILLLATTNFPLVPLLLIAWLVLGGLALLRERSARSICILTLAILSVGMGVIAPYPAIRYLSPAAFFLAPVLAAGIEESRRRIQWADALAYATLLLLIVYGGAVICAQAVSMRNSTASDWALLQYAARALGEGRDVVMLEDIDFERAFWVRAELAGVDARYPFITYVAHQSSEGLPIVWPRSPTGPVNLTGLLPAQPRGRFSTARPPYAFRPGSLVIPANPWVTSIPANVAEERAFDYTREGLLTRALQAFARFARLTNPKFRYPYDLGESEFPGSHWMTFTAR